MRIKVRSNETTIKGMYLGFLGLFGSSGFKTGPAKSPSKFGKTAVFETGAAERALYRPVTEPSDFPDWSRGFRSLKSPYQVS